MAGLSGLLVWRVWSLPPSSGCYLLAYQNYAAEGISETTVQAAAIPRAVFDDLVASTKSFRDFVFAAFSKRITDLFLIID